MSDLAFPLLGALAVYLVAVPAATVGVKAALAGARRRGIEPAAAAGGVTWLLLVAPVALTVPWFVSAAVHQARSGGALGTCLYDHLGGEVCQDVEWFAGATGLLLLSAVSSRLARVWREERRHAPAAADPELAARLRGLCAAHPELAKLRVRAVRRGRAPLCTVGLLRPWVEVDADFARTLDDATLRSALHHEAAHVAGLDPLRLFLLRVSLSINPAARLLRPELARWRFSRELECDREAVTAGAEPLALAQAILAAARPPGARACRPVVALAGDPMAGLRLRVGRMLAHVEQPWRPERTRVPAGSLRPLSALLMAVVAAPHLAGSGLLAALHWNIELGLARILF